MLLTKKLVGYLHRVFSKDPEQFLAIRLRYDGAMSWKIADGRLTTSISGGSGVALDVDLTTLTISSLASYLSGQAGYTVAFSVGGAQAGLSARVLLDDVGNQDSSNGDHIYAYTSLIWAYLDAAAIELTEAKAAIVEMLKQMSVSTSSGEYLDDLGDQYGIKRLIGEADAVYSNRIIASIIRPKGNNIAISMAIESATGGFRSTVVDSASTTVSQNIYRHGTFRYDGKFNRNSNTLKFYGQFDVEAGFDLLSSESVAALLVRIRAAVEQFRDAGTKLRQVTLSGAISDTARSGSDVSSITLMQAPLSDEYIGVRGRHDGTVLRGGLIVNQRRMRNRAGFYFDGSVRRDEADGVSNSATAFYGDDVDPSALSAQASLADSWSAELGYIGVAPRDGTFARSGARGIGIDRFNLSITRRAYHNGKFQRSGFPFSGHTTETM